MVLVTPLWQVQQPGAAAARAGGSGLVLEEASSPSSPSLAPLAGRGASLARVAASSLEALGHAVCAVSPAPPRGRLPACSGAAAHCCRTLLGDPHAPPRGSNGGGGGRHRC